VAALSSKFLRQVLLIFLSTPSASTEVGRECPCCQLLWICFSFSFYSFPFPHMLKLCCWVHAHLVLLCSLVHNDPFVIINCSSLCMAIPLVLKSHLSDV
jgi:hypothetical protein